MQQDEQEDKTIAVIKDVLQFFLNVTIFKKIVLDNILYIRSIGAQRHFIAYPGPQKSKFLVRQASLALLME